MIFNLHQVDSPSGSQFHTADGSNLGPSVPSCARTKGVQGAQTFPSSPLSLSRYCHVHADGLGNRTSCTIIRPRGFRRRGVRCHATRVLSGVDGNLGDKTDITRAEFILPWSLSNSKGISIRDSLLHSTGTKLVNCEFADAPFSGRGLLTSQWGHWKLSYTYGISSRSGRSSSYSCLLV